LQRSPAESNLGLGCASGQSEGRAAGAERRRHPAEPDVRARVIRWRVTLWCRAGVACPARPDIKGRHDEHARHPRPAAALVWARRQLTPSRCEWTAPPAPRLPWPMGVFHERPGRCMLESYAFRRSSHVCRRAGRHLATEGASRRAAAAPPAPAVGAGTAPARADSDPANLG
jgi:hypothetical protein